MCQSFNMNFIIFLCAILWFNDVYCNVVHYQPEQVHISFGDNASEIVITWTTFSDTNSSVVEFGIDGLNSQAFGEAKLFIDGGSEERQQYIHKVKLNNLVPEKIYLYHCGSELGWSPEFYFKSVRPTSDWAPHLAIYGDLGNENAQSLPRLQEEVQRGMYDAVLHVGDFAYDMDSDNAQIGDEFMRQIEPIAAYVPYMTCPGNHEEAYNYRARFNMPNGADHLYYSFNIGPAHIISFNTEYYYFLNYGIKSLILQYVWLENDLKEAVKPENRKQHPWIIVFGHRPMYCSDNDGDDCTFEDDLVRTGLPILRMFGLENLFYKYGVDLEIFAHEHSYERLWPVYDKQVRNGTNVDQPYTNPGAPVHIVTGSAGCKEKVDDFIKNLKPWSAFRSSDYGYTRLKIFNSTHVNMEQVSDDKNGDVIDNVWIIKDKHGLYDDSNNNE